MPPKRSNSKISFKIFSNDNHSRFANRFPFLKERQIKAKLLQAWRNKLKPSSETKTGKGDINKAKRRNETLFNGGKTDLLCFLYTMINKRIPRNAEISNEELFSTNERKHSHNLMKHWSFFQSLSTEHLHWHCLKWILIFWFPARQRF